MNKSTKKHLSAVVSVCGDTHVGNKIAFFSQLLLVIFLNGGVNHKKNYYKYRKINNNFKSTGWTTSFR